MADTTTTTTAASDAPSVATATVTTSTTSKPGWKTTEFWLGLAAKLLGGAYATGLLGEGTIAARIAGLAVVVLAYLGYTVSRTLVKAAGALLLIGALGTTQVSCATARPRATAGATVAIDCTAPDIAAIVGDVGHALVGYVLKYISGDGRHVDTTKLVADLKVLKGDVLGSCGVTTALAILATPKPPGPPSFYAEPSGPDPAEWAVALAAVRAELGVGAVKGG